jgi:hypothetical protein
MEMLDQKINMLLDVFSTPQHRQYSQESTSRLVLILEWPTPLQQRQQDIEDNSSRNWDSSQFK